MEKNVKFQVPLNTGVCSAKTSPAAGGVGVRRSTLAVGVIDAAGPADPNRKSDVQNHGKECTTPLVGSLEREKWHSTVSAREGGRAQIVKVDL